MFHIEKRRYLFLCYSDNGEIFFILFDILKKLFIFRNSGNKTLKARGCIIYFLVKKLIFKNTKIIIIITIIKNYYLIERPLSHSKEIPSQRTPLVSPYRKYNLKEQPLVSHFKYSLLKHFLSQPKENYFSNNAHFLSLVTLF